MNDVAEKLLVHGEAAFAKALEYVEATESFVVEQAPMLVQEILAYNLAYSVFWAVFCLALMSGIIWGGVKWFKAWMNAKEEDLLFVPVAVTAICGAFPTIGFFENLFTAMKITFAPRLFLLEQLRGLIK